MAGNREGSLKAAETNRRKYGLDFYKEIGKQGGSAPYIGLKGFAAHRDLASRVGRIGGTRSRRPKRHADN